MTAGLDAAEARLEPGHGTAEAWLGASARGVEAGADVQARLNRALSAFGSASLTFGPRLSGPDWQAQAGLRARW